MYKEISNLGGGGGTSSDTCAEELRKVLYWLNGKSIDGIKDSEILRTRILG